MVEVVAALIWDEKRFMICQRPRHKARGLLWEFVGGKVEPDESKEDALIRECREELDVIVTPQDVFTDVVHEYPDITVHLTVYNAVIKEGTPKLLEHEAIRWILPSEISLYEFCPADEEILKRIIDEKGDTGRKFSMRVDNPLGCVFFGADKMPEPTFSEDDIDETDTAF